MIMSSVSADYWSQAADRWKEIWQDIKNSKLVIKGCLKLLMYHHYHNHTHSSARHPDSNSSPKHWSSPLPQMLSWPNNSCVEGGFLHSNPRLVPQRLNYCRASPGLTNGTRGSFKWISIQEGWNQMIFKVSSNPNLSVIPWKVVLLRWKNHYALACTANVLAFRYFKVVTAGAQLSLVPTHGLNLGSCSQHRSKQSKWSFRVNSGLFWITALQRPWMNVQENGHRSYHLQRKVRHHILTRINVTTI